MVSQELHLTEFTKALVIGTNCRRIKCLVSFPDIEDEQYYGKSGNLIQLKKINS